MISPRWKKVIQDLWDNKSRTLLVVMSIAVGVIAFGGLFIARQNLIANLALQYDAINAYDIAISLPPFEDELVRWAERQDYITNAEGITVYPAEMLVDGVYHNATIHVLEDFSSAQINRVLWEAGSQTLQRNEFWLERSFVSRSGLEPNEEAIVELPNGNQYRLNFVGTVHDLTVQSGQVNPVLQVYVNPRTAHGMDLTTDFNQLYLTVERSPLGEIPTPAEIADALRHDLTLMGIDVGSIIVNDPREHWATNTLAGLVTMLFFFGSFSLLLSGFLVVNTISGFMAQQTKQIGIMKIIGASRGQIIGVYLVMVSGFGLLALIIALPVSIFLGRGIANFMTPVVNFDIVDFMVPAEILLLEVAVSFVAPLVSALSPVLNGTKISAAQAISDNPTRSNNNFIDIALAKIQGLPRPFLLSLRNMFRKKGRLLMTVITLVLAGAFFVGVLNLRLGFRTDIQTEAVRMSSYHVLINFGTLYNQEGIERRINQIEGAVFSEGWLNGSVSRVRSNNDQSPSYEFIGLPADSPFVDAEMEEGIWLPATERDNRYDIVITDGLLDDEPDIQLGDTITLTLPGGKEQDWRVVGIVDTFEGGTIYANRETAAQFLGTPDQINSVLIRGDDDTLAGQEALEDRVIDYLEDRDYIVANTETNASFITSIISTFDVIIALLLMIAVMIAIVGGLGLAGTMSLSVLERTREIGVMRSVGATTATLRFMFIAEGVMIGILSSLIAFSISTQVGIGLGQLLGNAMFGQPFAAIFVPEGLVLWLAIIIVISMVASLLPAQRASQISIREALSYE